MRKRRIQFVMCFLLLAVVAVLSWHPWKSNTAVAQVTEPAPPLEKLPNVADVTGGKPGDEVVPCVGLTDEAKVMLEQNGFVVVANEHPSSTVRRFYEECQWERQPIFVTSDAMLHESHLLFDWYLRFLETAHLRTDLLNLTDSCIAMSMAYWDQSRDRSVRDAALANAAYFYTAKALLGEARASEAPGDLKSKIERELGLIEAHRGMANSPLFGYPEDYSQYAPRGHYSRSPELASYFKAMMWYGRMSFRLKGRGLSKADARLETTQAALICKALAEGKAKGEQTLGVWKRIEGITAFFAGKADDLTPEEYVPAARLAFGNDLALSRIADTDALDRFRAKASALRKPDVLSTSWAVMDKRDWQSGTQGFRLMGQRFSFDSYAFQQLVFDRVGKWLGQGDKPFTWTNAQGVMTRGFPRGMDVLAVMGSNEAKSIVENAGDASYQGYGSRLAALKGKCAKLQTPQDLPSARLALLRTVMEAPSDGAPKFMTGSQAWMRKSLCTALGSWTEMRHDTILYTKESYSMAQVAFAGMGKGGPREKPQPVHGYVEPCPKIYAAIRGTIAQLRVKIQTLGFPPDQALTWNLTNMEDLLARLEMIAQEELKGHDPNEAEQDLIEHIGSRIPYGFNFRHYADVNARFQDRMDTEAAIVADVHTDVNSGMALEEATGNPMAIYVKVPVDGKPTICKGAVYSQYEFKQPMSDRLTDEKWRQMLREHRNPGLQAWTQAYIARTGRRPTAPTATQQSPTPRPKRILPTRAGGR